MAILPASENGVARTAGERLSGSPLQRSLTELHERLSSLRTGEVATYIPELAKAAQDGFAIAIATVEGAVYEVGDVSTRFTIQSISKPFVYGLALDLQGAKAVLSKVGVEPSGEAFNAISLEAATGRPRNPMINAGAITCASLVASSDGIGGLERLEDTFEAYAGRRLELDEAVFRSEKETGHRNRAIGHLLRNAGIIESDVDEVLDLYFQQCSLSGTARDLAIMGATLANGGTNPLTGATAVHPMHVEPILSIMSTCGMYDAAGAWVHNVGLPAKSGVGGGIVAVLPGQLGIGVYSPRLDRFGNSVRGVAVCEELSRRFALHFLKPPVSLRSVVRTVSTLALTRSSHLRGPVQAECISKFGGAVSVYHLQGPLVLSTAEVALNRALADAAPGRTAIFDLRRLDGMGGAVPGMIAFFVDEATRMGMRVLIAGLEHRPAWRSRLERAVREAAAGMEVLFFDALDSALEWCEEQILLDAGLSDSAEMELPLESHPLLMGLDPVERETLRALCVRRTFSTSERLMSQGEHSDEVFLLAAGRVTVSINLPEGRRYRVATLRAGVAVGELALLDQEARSADVDADGPVVTYMFKARELKRPSADPAVRARLIERLAGELAARLRRANAEIAALAT